MLTPKGYDVLDWGINLTISKISIHIKVDSLTLTLKKSLKKFRFYMSMYGS